jgi:hypothetical protein
LNVRQVADWPSILNGRTFTVKRTLRDRWGSSERRLDLGHGQTGVAPNAIELHPVLAFRCLRG